MSLKKWKTLDQKILFKNSHWTYKLDQFEIEGGFKSEYHFVHSPGSTMVVPFISNDKIVLVNQYRYLNKKESLEFPCGSVEDGLSLEANALKELQEEAGLIGTLKKIGEFSPYTGVSDEICSVFIAENLSQCKLPKDDTEDFEIITLSISEFEELIKNNQIWDGLTLAAWIIIRNYLDI